jgi:NAD(P)-dependent dehydrogenase (short-subunit alcohol dehydrogenase family)
MVSSKPLVWFLTGSTSGFGGAVAKAALARGDQVIATARNTSKPEMEELRSLGATTLALDITSPDPVIASVVAKAIAAHGRIDILLNNAAYILEGGIEECSREEIQAEFDTNVFGQLAVLRAVLPYMRAAKSGVVANMGSIGGWGSMANDGVYCATKATLVALTGALKQEVAHLGIDVILIEPGYFRTNFLSDGHKASPAKRIDDLKPAIEPRQKALLAYDRKQPGDLEKGAKLIVEVLTKSGRCEGRGTLPLRLLIGTDAVRYVTRILEQSKRDMEDWMELTVSTDLDDVAL